MDGYNICSVWTGLYLVRIQILDWVLSFEALLFQPVLVCQHLEFSPWQMQEKEAVVLHNPLLLGHLCKEQDKSFPVALEESDYCFLSGFFDGTLSWWM